VTGFLKEAIEINLIQNFGLAQIRFNQQLGIHHLPFGLMNN
jgi:hypothetical protein